MPEVPWVSVYPWAWQPEHLKMWVGVELKDEETPGRGSSRLPSGWEVKAEPKGTGRVGHKGQTTEKQTHSARTWTHGTGREWKGSHPLCRTVCPGQRVGFSSRKGPRPGGQSGFLSDYWRHLRVLSAPQFRFTWNAERGRAGKTKQPGLEGGFRGERGAPARKRDRQTQRGRERGRDGEEEPSPWGADTRGPSRSQVAVFLCTASSLHRKLRLLRRSPQSGSWGPTSGSRQLA